MKKREKILLLVMLCGMLLLRSSLVVDAETYEYDALNRVIKVSYEDGSYVEYEYDANGNILNIEVHRAQNEEEESPKPVETQKPKESPKPVETQKPKESPKPVETQKPQETSKPVETPKPEENYDDELSLDLLKKEIKTMLNVITDIIQWLISELLGMNR